MLPVSYLHDWAALFTLSKDEPRKGDLNIARFSLSRMGYHTHASPIAIENTTKHRDSWI